MVDISLTMTVNRTSHTCRCIPWLGDWTRSVLKNGRVVYICQIPATQA